MGIFTVAAPAQGFSQDSRQFLLDSFDISSSAGYTVINDEFSTASLLRMTSERAIDIPLWNRQNIRRGHRQGGLKGKPEIGFVNRGRKGLHTVETDLQRVCLEAMRQIYNLTTLSCAFRSPWLVVRFLSSVDGKAAERTNPELLEFVPTVRPEEFPLLAIPQRNAGQDRVRQELACAFD